jgi:two-component system, OmpR family, phosphate regulon sensor histidine kinase PhoR
VSENITPSKLSLYASIGISVLLFFLLVIINIPYPKTFLICGICGISSYAIIYSSVQKYFAERIKLIYRFISNKKDNYREEAYRKSVLPKTTLQDLEVDVQKWAQEQSNKEQQINALKENEMFRRDFLANFGHEIKTPIFSVQGYLHTLKDGAVNDASVRDKFIENASKGIDRLALLTKDLDMISNLESGKLSLDVQKFNIYELIIDVKDELTYAAQSKNISLSLIPTSTAQMMVLADKERIRQVLSNLMMNAIKYGNENGYVHISVFEIDNKNILVEVSDNGIGLEAHELNRVFERFYRSQSGRNKSKVGSGIGLAIVKHILEAHHQTITCRSTANVGSTFGFTLARDTK